METPPWYVITGGPSSGKTTSVERLNGLGYHVVPEAARVLIDENIKRGISVQETRKDELLFQHLVLQKKLQVEGTTPRDRVVFYDRGIPDSIAYFQIYGLDTQEVERVSAGRYRKVFFLEPLYRYTHDYARTEDEETVRRLNQLLPEAYENLGYRVVRLPPLSVEERLQLILSNL